MTNPLDLLGYWPEPRASAAVVVRDGDQTEVVAATGDIHAVAEWASVSKPVVALAVLAAHESNVLGLDDPAGPPGSTVRHLLSHASGLGPDSYEALTAPGRRRIYSNAGFEVLSRYLEQRAGRPWADVVADTVTGPLGLTSTEVRAGGSPASGFRGSVADPTRLAAELLIPRVLSAELLRQAVEVAFAGLAGVVPGIGRFEHCDWGLGFELKDSKTPHWTATTGSPETFGHFGRSGAFIWVDADAGVACVSAGGPLFGPWALRMWPEFADAVLSTFGSRTERSDTSAQDP
jgi:CubicO group peptidase (beta-lactamase class C family)